MMATTMAPMAPTRKKFGRLLGVAADLLAALDHLAVEVLLHLVQVDQDGVDRLVDRLGLHLLALEGGRLRAVVAVGGLVADLGEEAGRRCW